VYEITDRGAVEMHEWLSELVAVPVKEYLQFEAALSLLAGLPPDEAVPLLEQRCLALEMRIEQNRALHETAVKRGLPRLFVIEDEYMQALLDAELTFTRQLVADIRSGDLSGLDEWQSWHDSGGQQAPAFTFPVPDIGAGSGAALGPGDDPDPDSEDDSDTPGEPR
jgi:hypothetical protein